MDTRTGQIYELKPGQTPEQLAAELGASTSDIVSVNKPADSTCPKCHGTGSVRRGLFSKRFKPCFCTE